MPWVTSNVYPSPSAFYSPATACPHSWTAVVTQTAGSGQGSDDRWVDGEVGLQCCPEGLRGDGAMGCRPSGSGSWPVVECGEADAEENTLKTYDAAKWPASATLSVTALLLRYQTNDVGSSKPTASAPGETGASGSGNGGNGDSGMSTGAIAAIATVIPLFFIIAALAAFTLWRRKKARRAALLASRNSGQEKAQRPSSSTDGTASHTYHSVPKGTHDVGSSPLQHETPEWNIEMDATEAERQNLVRVEPAAAAVAGGEDEVAELGGLRRVPRKAIAPVEIDGKAVLAEVGDAYIAYRPGVQG